MAEQYDVLIVGGGAAGIGAAKALRAAGVRVDSAPEPGRFGPAFVRDPDGNRVELMPQRVDHSPGEGAASTDWQAARIKAAASRGIRYLGFIRITR